MDRHIFPDHASLVNRSLRGLVASHPSLTLLPATRTVINAAHDVNKVSLICGGGSGHEPGTTGFVGRGFLSASVAGDTFASPSAKQVLTAISAVPSSLGTILLITNYTGDNLHFGLACQQARAAGLAHIAILPVCDDVSVTRTKGALVGRRAMAGTVLMSKILGAASEAGYGFDDTLNVGRAVGDGLCSIGATLGHCHVPGRDNAKYGVIESDTIEIGLGLHNEAGVFVVSPQPSPEELIKRMLGLLLDQEDEERAFVPFGEGDGVVLFVNNMGGMSVLEMFAVVDEVTSQIEAHPLKLRIERTQCGSFMTSLNAPGFSITLLNVSHTARQLKAARSAGSAVSSTGTRAGSDKGDGEKEILALYDAPHASAAWPGATLTAGDPVMDKLRGRPRQEKFVDIPEVVEVKEEESVKVLVNARTLRRAIRAGAQAVYDAEPELTMWDTIVGDGDCGETCMLGAAAVLAALDKGLGEDGDLVRTLREVTQIIDDSCGGTLGAIYSIFLAALTAEVRLLGAGSSTNVDVDVAFWGAAAGRAVATLGQSTKARVGHRTVMDAIIPFVEGLSAVPSTTSLATSTTASSPAPSSTTQSTPAPSSSLAPSSAPVPLPPASHTVLTHAIAQCVASGEGTKDLVAKLGRATYVGTDRGALPPDPGAMSMVFFVRAVGGVFGV